MTQDDDGYIWLGTSNGLARFDGYEIRTYLDEIKPPGKFDSNVVRALADDSNDNLWIGTLEGGLHRYNRTTENFTNFTYINDISSLNDKSDSGKNLSASQVIALATSRKNQLWVGTTSGINRVDLTTGEVKHFRSRNRDKKSQPEDYVYSIFVDKSDTVWIGTKAGLAYFNESNDAFSYVKLVESNQPKVRSITSGSDNNLLIGTYQGLFQYEHSSMSVKHITQGIGAPIVLSVIYDQQKNIWLGTFDKGVFKISAQNRVSQYSYDRTQSQSLSDDTILSLFLDREKNIWAGTFSGGVNWINRNSRNFGLYNDSQSSIPCLPNPTIYSAYLSSQEDLWLGSSSGLTRFNRKTRECKSFDSVSGDLKTLSSSRIYAIQEDTQKNLWVGTGKGLNRIKPSANEINQFKDSFPSEIVYAIEEGSKEIIYIGTNRGFYIKKSSVDSFEKIKLKDKTLKSVNVRAIDIDTNNQVYLGTNKGLYWFNQDNQLLELVKREENPAINSPISSLYRDDNGNLWVGAEQIGLIKLNHDYKEQRRITEKDGLPTTQELSNILADDRGNLWVSSPLGIAYVNLENSTIHSYRSRDGLQGDVFIRGAAFKAETGELLFGGRYGLNIFFPEKIIFNEVAPKVHVTNFFHFNKPVVHNDKDAKFKLDKPISQIKELELSHRDYIIGFEFTAVHLADPSRNKYAYMMEGLDPEWNYTDATNRHVSVTYNNLKTGDYTFRVKAANKDGVWNDTGTQIAIRVLPAPWLTWWAFTIYLLSALLLILFVIYKRTSILRQRAIELEKTVSARTTELREEKQKVEQLLSRKNEEFANVSHEFRTPLSLILPPIQQMMKSEITNPKNRKLLKLANRNALRLHKLVNQLLDFGKI
ncbi:MAG: triple tyrosine motif-containing protein, partial [Kangiellaceae bacterium]|nr:triple tyrosine motif-containing protein [Kangiellaceae bacterium]